MPKSYRLAVSLITLILILIAILNCALYRTANATPLMPELRGNQFVLRAKFTTTYEKSIAERKHNIKLASKSLNKTFIESGVEFSFNQTVGARTEKRGYKTAKIISNGKFIDGVGGGVCQVSTTLYNAVLLADLKITEYHPHSLEVPYCAPSFDAMVNSGGADLRFYNDTGMPVYILTSATDSALTISIYGKKMDYKIERKSIIKNYLDYLEPETLIDENGEYPKLYEGETQILNYGKRGLKSEGYLVYKDRAKTIEIKKVRSDKYSSVKGVVVIGTKKRPEMSDIIQEN